ncbi:MAG: 50S ribosomal protein L31 [Bdellovibrionales bacterium]|nr:50S ribosomal protein L31 [Bdellovibrionales bacterium]
MKEGIHPKYHQDAKYVCGGCGTEFSIGSVLPEVNISVCGNCHPHYTGKSKVLDSEGRVDRFNKKYAKFNEQRKAKKAS